MNIDPHAYNITIRRAVFEGETLFEARVKELPDLAEYGESFDEAYELAVDAIETAAEAFAENGRVFPSAIVPIDEFSGRVTLRLPRSLHRAMAGAAEVEGVSLNQHLVNVLSYYSGFATGSSKLQGTSPWRTVPVAAETNRATAGLPLRLVQSNNLENESRAAWGNRG